MVRTERNASEQRSELSGKISSQRRFNFTTKLKAEQKRHERQRDRWMSRQGKMRTAQKCRIEWLVKRVMSSSPYPIRPFSSSAWRSSDEIEFIWPCISLSLSLWGGKAMIRVIIIYYERIPSQAKHLILQYSTVPHTHSECNSMRQNLAVDLFKLDRAAVKDTCDWLFNCPSFKRSLFSCVQCHETVLQWFFCARTRTHTAPRSCNLSWIFRASDFVPFSRALLIWHFITLPI